MFIVNRQHVTLRLLLIDNIEQYVLLLISNIVQYVLLLIDNKLHYVYC